MRFQKFHVQWFQISKVFYPRHDPEKYYVSPMRYQVVTTPWLIKTSFQFRDLEWCMGYFWQCGNEKSLVTMYLKREIFYDQVILLYKILSSTSCRQRWWNAGTKHHLILADRSSMGNESFPKYTTYRISNSEITSSLLCTLSGIFDFYEFWVKWIIIWPHSVFMFACTCVCQSVRFTFFSLSGGLKRVEDAMFDLVIM